MRVRSRPIRSMMLASREAVVNYMTPLGIVHIMATGPSLRSRTVGGRRSRGLDALVLSPGRLVRHGFRSHGDGQQRGRAVLRRQCAIDMRVGRRCRTRCCSGFTVFGGRIVSPPDARSGTSSCIATALVSIPCAAMQRTWLGVRAGIDSARFAEVASFLDIQAREAKWWRDASLAYFQTFSKLPIPSGYEQPAHPLNYYIAPVSRGPPQTEVSGIRAQRLAPLSSWLAIRPKRRFRRFRRLLLGRDVGETTTSRVYWELPLREAPEASRGRTQEK